MAATPPKDDEQAAIEAAVTPADPADRKLTARDKQSAKAHDAELERQQAVVDAVAAAGEKELPKIGGPLLDPGLGQ